MSLKVCIIGDGTPIAERRVITNGNEAATKIEITQGGVWRILSKIVGIGDIPKSLASSAILSKCLIAEMPSGLLFTSQSLKILRSRQMSFS